MCISGKELGGVYSAGELTQLLGSVGENVSINRSVVFYSPQNIHIGSNVRIDCFCILASGADGIVIGDYVHIGAYSALFGSLGQIRMESFSGLSARVLLFTSTDDYTDGFLANPTVPDKYKRVRKGDIVLERHAIIGAGSVVMPGVTLGVAASAGAMTFLHRSVSEFAIVVGCPMRVVGRRNARILDLEAEFLAEKNLGAIPAGR